MYPILGHQGYENLQIVDVKIILSGPNTFGDVLSGEIFLRSPYLLLFTLANPPAPSQGEVHSEVIPERRDSAEQRHLGYKFRFFFGNHDYTSGRLFLLGGSIRQRRGRISSLAEYYLAGMVLRATYNKQGEYKRVGFFEMDRKDYKREDWNELMSFLNEDTKPEQSDYIGILHVDEKGRKIYTVCII
jgi:hypothetical protein